MRLNSLGYQDCPPPSFARGGCLPSGGRGIASLERFLDHDNGLSVQGTAISLGGGGERGEQGVRQAQT